MNEQTEHEAEPERPARRGASDDGGFVLTWFAILLIVLIAMAGFGVDVWNWWYTSQKVQRAADAGALGGVVFMPANFNGPSPSATTTATALVKQNGFIANGSTIKVAVAQTAKASQLQVTVTQTVSNVFTSLLGVKTTTISRTAIAEFNAPIQMGSPNPSLGNDPEHQPTVHHWLNIGAPAVNKQTGDRYADYANCSGAFDCNGSSINTEYLQNTYVFTVDMPSAGDIQVYDPEYAVGNTNCDNQWLSSTQISTLAGETGYSDAATRFATGSNDYCTGDDNTNLGTPQATAWIVRNSSVSTVDQLSNPVVTSGGPNGGACVKQFQGYNPTSGNYWFDLLDKNNTDNNSPSKYDPDFAASFHRFYTLCHVTAAGRYYIQVRSNVPYKDAASAVNPTYLTQDESSPNTSIGGQNRYSIRAVQTGTSNVLSGAAVYAETHLPVYTNTPAGNSPTFYLARLLPGGGSSGRVLHLSFYDIGDLASGNSTTLTINPPSDASGGAPTCSSWTANGNQAMPTSSISGCTVSGITSNTYPSGFNGVLITANIAVPGTYTCSTGSSTGCWFTITMSYSQGGQANDTTTWDANVGGDPVRLVQ